MKTVRKILNALTLEITVNMICGVLSMKFIIIVVVGFIVASLIGRTRART
ncbi:hypothetical protein [Leuconostoc suionicum]|nr:hypothetical protein [Leuconostoc suionicum]